MDILFDQPLSHGQLNEFLQGEFPDLSWILVDENDDYWEQLANYQWVFQCVVDQDLAEGFKYGLDLYLPSDDALPIIETLSAHLSRHFDCSVLCDGSRVVLKEQNVYYSLLFERGEVFLVDDYDLEETGQVKKIVALAYKSPGYGTLGE